jgi:hypothetical protein
MATTCKLIAKNVLGSSASTVTFSSIPSTYTDLLLVASARTGYTSSHYQGIYVRPNGATTNLSSRVLYGAGSSAGSLNYGSDLLIFTSTADATASTFASCEIYIPNYAGSTNKSVSASWGVETNSSTANILGATAGLWASTSAITSIDLVPLYSASFVADSSFFLYGITKA